MIDTHTCTRAHAHTGTYTQVHQFCIDEMTILLYVCIQGANSDFGRADVPTRKEMSGLHDHFNRNGVDDKCLICFNLQYDEHTKIMINNVYEAISMKRKFPDPSLNNSSFIIYVINSVIYKI